MMFIMNKYLRAISVNFIFFVVSVVFFLLITPLAIKIMGEELFGLWAILSALMLFSNVGTLNIGAIVMKFLSEAPENYDLESRASQVMVSGYIIVFVMALLTAAILFLTRNVIVDSINLDIKLKGQFRLAYLIILIGVFPQFLSRVPHGYLLSRLYNREARQLEILSSISLWIGAVVLAWMSKNLVHIAVWSVFNNFFVLILYIKTVQRLLPLHMEIDILTLRNMLNFSGYMFLESLSIALFQHVDKVIVGITLGPVLAGVYSVGTSLALRLPMLTGQATEVMIPYASLKESLGDRERLFSVFRQLSYYVGFFLAGLGSVLIIWMQEIISFWISPDYAVRYSNVFRLLIVAYGWLSLCRPAHQALTGLGRVKFTAFTYFISTMLMLFSLFFWSSRFGLVGAAVSNMLMICLLVFNIFVYYLFQATFRWRDLMEDLRLGMFLPIIVYGLTQFLFYSSPMYKFGETIMVGILFSWLIAGDKLMKNKFIALKQTILHFKV